MTQLPFPDDLRVDRAKVVDYLLSASNGRGKAAFFTRYRVDGGIDTPSRREPRPYVRTVWTLEPGSSQQRLITAHPI